ncbi:MAG: hypothetical protein MRZ59_06250 [Clostridiales bacterium]|nr:hypothetical protein [Clostridiales bacterium]
MNMSNENNHPCGTEIDEASKCRQEGEDLNCPQKEENKNPDGETKVAAGEEKEGEVKIPAGEEKEGEVKIPVGAEREGEEKTPADGESDEEAKTSGNEKGKRKWLIPAGIAAAFMIVIIIIVVNALPKITRIKVQYTGDCEAGVVLDETNEGFMVIGIKENGDRVELKHWKIEEPATLEPDSASKITISYKDFSESLTIRCTTSVVTEIEAEYRGSKEAGVVIDNDSEIIVKAIHKDGSVTNCEGWAVEEPAKLTEDQSVTVRISYEDVSCSLTVKCATSAVTGIEAQYNGNTEAGTEINDQSKFIVKKVHKNGTRTTCPEWKVKENAVLEADGTAEVVIVYDQFETTCEIECSTVTMVELTAEYDGDTKENVVLDEENDGIHVTAKYKNGKTEEVKDYAIEQPKTLKAGETSTIKITYKEMSCELKVECSTLSESQYKAKCESIAYDKLARNPDKYDGKMVKFTGQVVQTIGNSGLGALRVNVTKDRYGYEDTVYVSYLIDSSNRILEDDIITFYGVSMGLYSYESVMGATITIPEVLAVYIDFN